MTTHLKSNSKKILNLILIVLLLLNSGVYVLLYFSSLKFVKKTIHYLIENNGLKEELIILSISKNDIEKNIVKFEWVEDKEFRFNGIMFDVKKDLSDSDSLRFLCYMDEHENLLEKLFNRFSDSNKNNSSNQPLKLTFTPFLGLFFQETECLNNLNELATFSFSNQIFLIHNYQEVLTPPPQSECDFLNIYPKI